MFNAMQRLSNNIRYTKQRGKKTETSQARLVRCQHTNSYTSAFEVRSTFTRIRYML